MTSFLIAPLVGPDSMNIGNCSWKDTFDDEQRDFYYAGLIFTGTVSQFFTMWLNLGLVLTSLWFDEDYKHFALFVTTMCLRRVTWGLIHLPPARLFDSLSKKNVLTCVMFAVQDCFFAVLELEALTHVCISRYVISRYAANKWPMNKQFILLYIFITVMFAIVYTIIPSFKYGGSFAYDLSCTTCGVDMILPNNYELFIVLFLFFMRSVKPVLVMTSALARSYYLDKNVCTDPEVENRKTFTRTVIAITTVILLSWLPLGAIRGYVIIGQLFYDKNVIIKSMVGLGEMINWAMFLYWVSPTLMVITAMVADKKIRYNMTHLISAANSVAETANEIFEKAEKERMEKQKRKGKKRQ